MLCYNGFVVPPILATVGGVLNETANYVLRGGHGKHNCLLYL